LEESLGHEGPEVLGGRRARDLKLEGYLRLRRYRAALGGALDHEVEHLDLTRGQRKHEQKP
jgi:hypothetical protein